MLNSLKVLFTRPGAITNAYVLGPRKPYIGPFQLFLIVNVAFFAVQAFAESPIFSTSLHSHMYDQDWSAFARTLVARKLEAAHTTLAAYTPVFEHAVDVNARSLVILLVLPFTLLLIPLFAGSRRPFVTHLVFSLHLLAFLLLCSCVLLLLTLLETRWAALVCARRSWTGERSRFWSQSSRRTCTSRPASSMARQECLVALKVALLAVVIAAAVPGYRFLILVVTLYTT